MHMETTTASRPDALPRTGARPMGGLSQGELALLENPEIMEALESLDALEGESQGYVAIAQKLDAIHASIDGCSNLLLFADAFLAVLIGCLCASIFSRFMQVRR